LPDLVTFTTAAHSQLRLTGLDKQMFPIPKYSLTPKKDLRGMWCIVCPFDVYKTSQAIPGLPSNTQAMSSNLRLGLRPYSPPGVDLEITSPDKFHPAASGSEPILLSPSMRKKIRVAKANIQKHLGCDVSSLVDGGSQVGVIPLGTGGSVPNKYRNGEFLHTAALKLF
jgi:ribonuclease Z